jgi:hypothetical protein
MPTKKIAGILNKKNLKIILIKRNELNKFIEEIIFNIYFRYYKL